MSYLDVPRLHFSGLFFTGPATINNIIRNYNPAVPLVNSSGQYLPNAIWNPTGVAQWWLEECTVLSAVGPGGVAATNDEVIGANVLSPTPTAPMSDGAGGFYDVAKMVDLDPDQQGRSALYGVRIAVVLPNGAGLQGLMTVPELRQLNGRIPVNGGSWTAVGNWMGTLQNVEWSGDISGSPILTSLQEASAQGLNVKLTVDLHQNNPANVSTAGDMFCYGRVLGSIAPAFEGELAQVVPGRYLQALPAPSDGPTANAAGLSEEDVTPPRERVAAQMAALAERRAATPSGTAAAASVDADTTTLSPWNPAFALICNSEGQTLLNVDIGGSILLNVQGTSTNPTSDGTFEVDSGITVGVVDLTTNQFVALANGNLTISPQYQQLVSSLKNCMLVKNSCVFTIPITEADGENYKTNPLAIQVNGTTVIQELASGLWMDVSVSSQRVECGGTEPPQAQIMVRTFGNPPAAGTAPPVTVSVQPTRAPAQPTDIGISIGDTDVNGLADITTTENIASLTLPKVRQPLDSMVYYVFLSDPQGNVIGDGSPAPPPNAGAPPPPLSVLLWNPFKAPAHPTWNDVGSVFSAYARLYPGMKSILDISNEQTVKASAPTMLAHMGLPLSDPAYMPVTRDLSPSKVNMMVSWLKSLVK
jgi:hypothetical protein